MSLQTTLALFFTVFASISVVSIIILLGWLLIWKAFLSKFRLVRELLGHGNGGDETAEFNRTDRQSHTRAKKLRKD